MKKLIGSLIIAVLALAGCNGNTDSSGELKINIAVGNVDRTITYNQADPLEMPDGTVITNGELKPVWQTLENTLELDIVDTAIQDQKATEMMEVEAATHFKNSTFYGGDAIAEQLGKYGVDGYFIDLNDYKDELPNFFNFLEENDLTQTVSSHDGGIYYFPYVAEIGNYARVFTFREDWVTSLLDSDSAILAEDETLEVAYEAFWTENGKTVIELQDEKAVDGVLSATDARDVLVAYINDTYDYANPSELYLGENAKYNMDELTALLRVVKLHPNTLTTVSTGEAVDGAYIAPYFVRQASYREDLFRFVNYFGGTRVFGADSYGSQLVLNEDGVLEYSYADEDFLEGLDRLKQMYSEGLIATEFSNLEDTTNFRTDYYGKDDVEGHSQFGFMTNDWIASTTAINEDVTVVLPPMTTIGDSDEMVHFVENTRTVKPDGYAISSASSDEEIARALKLTDYIYSDEGSTLQNYGTSDLLTSSEKTYVGPDGVSYPEFNEWVVASAGEYKSGDVSSFLKDYVGAHIPIGYLKEIGFEYQYTTESGFEAWALWQNAGVQMPSYGAEDPLFTLTPSAYSLNDQQVKQVETTDIGVTQTDMLFLYVVGADNAPASTEEIRQNFEDKGIELYEATYNEAYAN